MKVNEYINNKIQDNLNFKSVIDLDLALNIRYQLNNNQISKIIFIVTYWHTIQLTRNDISYQRSTMHNVIWFRFIQRLNKRGQIELVRDITTNSCLIQQVI